MTEYEASIKMREIFQEGDKIIDHINCSYFANKEDFHISLKDAYLACRFVAVSSFYVAYKNFTGAFPSCVDVMTFVENYEKGCPKHYGSEKESGNENGQAFFNGHSSN